MKRLFKKRKKLRKDLPNVASDTITSGLLNDIFLQAPIGLQNVLTIATTSLSATAVVYNHVYRKVNNERIQQVIIKEKEKIITFRKDIEKYMKLNKVEDLRRFVDFNFPLEQYNLYAEIIQCGINAKSESMRKLAAIYTVNIGNGHAGSEYNLARTVKVLKELDDIDIQMLILLQAFYSSDKANLNTARQELLNNKDIPAHSIFISSLKLRNLGLTYEECGTVPYDDNKEKLIDEFQSKNGSREKTLLYE